MIAQIDDGGPAFPFGQVSELTGQPINGFFSPGMTLRDWFAGQALIGLMTGYHDHPNICKTCAELAFEAADEMIAARKGGAK